MAAIRENGMLSSSAKSIPSFSSPSSSSSSLRIERNSRRNDPRSRPEGDLNASFTKSEDDLSEKYLVRVSFPVSSSSSSSCSLPTFKIDETQAEIEGFIMENDDNDDGDSDVIEESHIIKGISSQGSFPWDFVVPRVDLPVSKIDLCPRFEPRGDSFRDRFPNIVSCFDPKRKNVRWSDNAGEELVHVLEFEVRYNF